jgi:hypothetical protein
MTGAVAVTVTVTVTVTFQNTAARRVSNISELTMSQELLALYNKCDPCMM